MQHFLYQFYLQYVDTAKRPLKGTSKFSLYEQLPFIYRLKLYALLINWKMRLLFIDSDLLHRGVLYRLICYIEVPFIDSDLLHRGALYRQ